MVTTSTGTPIAARARGARRGYSLAEGLLGLAILASVIVGVTRFLGYSSNTQESRAAATRMSLLSQAADAYLKNFGPNVAFALASGDPVAIPMTANEADHPEIQALQNGLPSFQEAGVLGANFRDSSANGQKTVLAILPPSGPGKQMEAFLINYGGTPLSDAILTGAEGMSEGRVGAVLANDPEKTVDAVGVSPRGARGGWAAPATSFASLGVALAPSAGHLVSYISETGNGLAGTSDPQYLCRAKSSNPVCNQLTTDTDLTGHGFQNVGYIQSLPSKPVQVIGDVEIEGASTVNGDSTVNGSQAVTGSQSAATYYGNDGTNSPYSVTPNGNTVLQSLNIDSLATSNVRVIPQGVRIADLIPTTVNKDSEVATNGQVVPKPNCGGTSGDPHNELARIFAYPIGIYNEGNSATSVSTTPTLEPVNVVTGITPAANNQGIDYTTGTVGELTKIQSDATTTGGRTYNYLGAIDNGASWTFLMVSYASEDQGDGTYALDLTDPIQDYAGRRNQALVQTACYYQ